MLCVTAYVALLRAVNVGGTGKLPMRDLKAIGEACGFDNVRTFIASGNLLFDSGSNEADVREAVEQRLEELLGKKVPVLVRTAAEMYDVVAGNPFRDAAPNRVVAHFIDEAPTKAMLEAATGVQEERMELGDRAIYIFYGDGMGSSKLKLPVFATGTARNLNSVARIAALLA